MEVCIKFLYTVFWGSLLLWSIVKSSGYSMTHKPAVHKSSVRSLDSSIKEYTQGCGITKGCFQPSISCIGNTCDQIITWKRVKDSIDFTLIAKYDTEMLGADQYVSFGFSQDGGMANAGVIDCILYGGEFKIQASYNEGYSNRVLENIPKDALTGSCSLVDSNIVCNIRRKVLVSSEPLSGDLNKKYFIIVASFEIAITKSLKFPKACFLNVF